MSRWPTSLRWVVRQFEPDERILCLATFNRRQSWYVFVIPTGLPLRKTQPISFTTKLEGEAFLDQWLKTRPMFLGRVMVAEYDELRTLNPLSPFQP